jgi:sugar phosphate isomerase/epimerase
MKLLSTLALVTACLLARPSAEAAPELGLQAWTFRNLSLTDTLDRAHTLGIRYLQAYPGQELGGGLPGKFTHTLDAATLAKVLALAQAKDVTITSYGVITPKDDAEWAALFAFAQAAGLKEIVTEATPEVLAAIAPTVAQNHLRISLHDHPEPSRYARPETALAAVAALSRDFGLCADTGHWARTGLDPVASLRLAAGRINSLHFKDIAERGRPSRDVPWGTGTSDVAGQLAELRRQKFDGIAYIEYEHVSPALYADVERCVAYFRAAEKASDDDLVRNRVVPAGFSADAEAVFAEGRGRDSLRWPTMKPLFARDLSNAVQAYPGAWAFSADGVLAPVTTPGAQPNGDLWTKDNYADFVVSLEFRTQEKSNSGVFLRSSDIVNWLQNSIEIQILQGDDDKPVHLVGSVYDVAAPTRAVPISPGEWYHYVIVARGSTITVTLNGEDVNKVDLEQWNKAGFNPDGTPNKFTKAYKDMARTGRVGLQFHKTPIEFRNLFIQRL